MTDYVQHGGIRIAKPLYDLVRDEIAPGTGVTPEAAWSLLDSVVQTLGPRNRALLAKRDSLQAQIDAWLSARRGTPLEHKATAAFLHEIGYLAPVGPDFRVTGRSHPVGSADPRARQRQQDPFPAARSGSEPTP